MSTTIDTTIDPVMPSEEEAAVAREASRTLAAHAARPHILRLRIFEKKKTGHELKLPRTAVRHLLDLLTQMGKGNAVTVIPDNAELTTQRAADLLNVSRPFLVKLIEQRKIPHRKVGTHRRILVKDLMRYKRQIDSDRRKVLDELVEETEKLGMGY